TGGSTRFQKIFSGPRSARERAWRPTLIIRKWPRRLSSVIAGARGDAVKIERELLLCNPLICRVSSAVEQRFCKPLVGSSNLSPGTNGSAPAAWGVARCAPARQCDEAVHLSRQPSEFLGRVKP